MLWADCGYIASWRLWLSIYAEVKIPSDSSSRTLVPEVIKFEFVLNLKIKPNDWLLADTCSQAASHCALFEFETVLKFFNLGARFLYLSHCRATKAQTRWNIHCSHKQSIM